MSPGSPGRSGRSGEDQRRPGENPGLERPGEGGRPAMAMGPWPTEDAADAVDLGLSVGTGSTLTAWVF